MSLRPESLSRDQYPRAIELAGPSAVHYPMYDSVNDGSFLLPRTISSKEFAYNALAQNSHEIEVSKGWESKVPHEQNCVPSQVIVPD